MGSGNCRRGRFARIAFGAAAVAGLGSAAWVALVAGAASCAPRAVMCGAPRPGLAACAPTDSCVAGRCQPSNGGAPAIDEKNDAGYVVRRLVLSPVDVAWVRRGDRAGASGGPSAMPAVFALGRASDGDAVLFTRFAVSLPKDAVVVEAYLLLARSDAVDADPTPVSLHAARIVEPWDSRTVSWTAQPRTEDVRAPSTRVGPFGGAVVRLDVRALVERWAQHARRDQGIAVVAENASASGVAFAFLAPVAGAPLAGMRADATGARAPAALHFGGPDFPGAVAVTVTPELPGAAPVSPRLELYVK